MARLNKNDNSGVKRAIGTSFSSKATAKEEQKQKQRPSFQRRKPTPLGRDTDFSGFFENFSINVIKLLSGLVMGIIFMFLGKIAQSNILPDNINHFPFNLTGLTVVEDKGIPIYEWACGKIYEKMMYFDHLQFLQTSGLG